MTADRVWQSRRDMMRLTVVGELQFWVIQHFHSVIYSVSNDAENYFIRAPMLNACLLKSAADLNCSHDVKFEVPGKYLFIMKSESYFHLQDKPNVFSKQMLFFHYLKCLWEPYQLSLLMLTHIQFILCLFSVFKNTDGAAVNVNHTLK